LSDRVGRNHGCPQCGRLRIIASHFKKVVCVETNEVFLSIKEAAIKHGLNRQCISNCCKGKQETTGGYHWKFVDN
ncbi:MAG: hypothetical protein IKC00_03155, partial [Clostridia bacterium]|nr:hypothetical protein [Clostridia bacterium]